MFIAPLWVMLIAGQAATLDVKSRRIPNLLLALGLLGLLLLQALFSQLQPLSLLVGLVVGFFGWATKIWGGGDGKLLALVCALVPLSQLPLLLCFIFMAGGVQALVWHLVKKATTLPYGVAIFIGTLVYLNQSCW